MSLSEATPSVSSRPLLRVIHGTAGAPHEPEPTLPLDFDDAFRRYAPYVGAIALKILGRDDEVDDLVQDVFIKAHRGLSRLQDPLAIKGWLATVTVRLARRRLRLHWFSRVLHLADLNDTDRAVDHCATPEQRAIVSSVYRYLDRVPASERIVWVLRQVEGKTLEEIAQLCECSLSTVQRRLKTARALMEQAGSDD